MWSPEAGEPATEANVDGTVLECEGACQHYVMLCINERIKASENETQTALPVHQNTLLLTDQTAKVYYAI